MIENEFMTEIETELHHKNRRGWWEKIATVTYLKVEKQTMVLVVLFGQQEYQLLKENAQMRSSLEYQIKLKNHKVRWEGFISEFPIVSDKEWLGEAVQIFQAELKFEVDGEIEGNILNFKMQKLKLSFWRGLLLRIKLFFT